MEVAIFGIALCCIACSDCIKECCDICRESCRDSQKEESIKDVYKLKEPLVSENMYRE